MRTGTNPYLDVLRRADIVLGDICDVSDNALLIGNGDINALYYREADRLMMHLTKNDVWDSRLFTEIDPQLITAQELIETIGNPKTGEEERYIPKNMDSPFGPQDSYSAHPYPCPVMCAKLHIVTGNPAAQESHRLSLADAAIYSHVPAYGFLETLAHADRNVYIIRGIRALQDVYLEPLHHIDMDAPETGESGDIRWIRQEIPGDRDLAPSGFAVAMKWQPEAETLWISIATTKETGDPLELAAQLVQSCSSQATEQLSRQHRGWWGNFWSASGIALEDPLLEKLWYRNLYMLACVSRSGKAAPGLFAGLVSANPQWHGDYHTNYNFQQIFWGAYAANHPDLTDPYDGIILNYLSRAKWLAETVFQVEGAYYPHVLYQDEPKPEVCRSNNKRQYFHHVWGRTLGLSAFCVQNLWWHYLYTKDADLLQTVYPAIRETAEFYSNWGKFYPTVSPEHWGLTKGLALNSDCTFDIAMIKYIVKAAVEASSILGQDSLLRDNWLRFLQQVPDYPTTPEAEPVIVDVKGAPPIVYNVPVPATPIFPGEDITIESEPEKRQLALRTLERMRTNENNDLVISSMADIRLQREQAYTLFRNRAQRRLRENGTLSLSPGIHPFNRGGIYTETFGVVMPINELLLQSAGGKIKLFPAWPRHLHAEFTNLRTEGAFLISAKLENGEFGEVLIQSLKGGRLSLKNEWENSMFRLTDPAGHPAAYELVNGYIEMSTEAGKTYHIAPQTIEI